MELMLKMERVSLPKVYRVIDGETVGEDNQEVAPVIPEEPAKPTMPVQTVTPATMPINKQTMFEGPAVEEAGPNGVAFSGTRVEPNYGCGMLAKARLLLSLKRLQKVQKKSW